MIENHDSCDFEILRRQSDMRQRIPDDLRGFSVPPFVIGFSNPVQQSGGLENDARFFSVQIAQEIFRSHTVVQLQRKPNRNPGIVEIGVSEGRPCFQSF